MSPSQSHNCHHHHHHIIIIIIIVIIISIATIIIIITPFLSLSYISFLSLTIFPGVWVMGRIFDGYFDKIDLPSPTEGGFDNLIAFNFKLCTVSLSEMQNVKTRRDMRADSFVLLWCSRCTYVCHLHQSSKITLYSLFLLPGLLRVPERCRGGKSKGGRDHFIPLWQHQQQQQQQQQ